MKVRNIFTILGISVTIAACDQTIDPFNDPEFILTSVSEWQFTSRTWSDNNGNSGNYYQNAQPCEVDDNRVFYSDGTFETFNGSKCLPSEPDIVSQGDWKFSSDKKELTLTFSHGGILNCKIVTINRTKLEYTFEDKCCLPTIYTNRVVWTALNE